MFKTIKKGILPFLIGFSALSVSASAAFYSVSGLSKLFAGAQFEVIIMAGSLEVAKLVTASLLYQYWDTINKILRTYLTVATIVLVLITSMGIYGFLSAAYQDTYRQLTIKENQTSFLTQKKDFYEKDVIRYDKELERISSNINILSNAKAQSIQVRDTTVSGGVRQTISTTELRLSQKRIEVEEENRKNVQSKREIVADSLQKYQLKILDLENNLDIAGELGPLQYLSGLTGAPMDKIINILLLVIIFVFDPLAISLVIASNFAFVKAFPPKKKVEKENLKKEPTQTLIWENDIDVKKSPSSLTSTHQIDKEFDEGFWSSYNEEDEQRMNIIGQNGNDGEHYEDEEFNDLDLNKDGIIDENERSIAENKIKELEKKIKPGVSGFRLNKFKEEINKIKKSLEK
tara:strand:+ start:1380 stop:2588 length:1209 start_codon:yes stop_codon:yes gene_type:complete